MIEEPVISYEELRNILGRMEGRKLKVRSASSTTNPMLVLGQDEEVRDILAWARDIEMLLRGAPLLRRAIDSFLRSPWNDKALMERIAQDLQVEACDRLGLPHDDAKIAEMVARRVAEWYRPGQ